MPDWDGHLRARLASLDLSGPKEAAIVDELVEHLDQRYEELRADGHSHPDAERLTIAELLETHALADRLQTLRLPRLTRAPAVRPAGIRWPGEVWRDVRHAIRILGAHPLFTAAATLTLAFGIGLNTTVFSLFNAVLFKPLPVQNGDRLAIVAGYLNDDTDALPVAYPDYVAMRDGNATFARLEASASSPATMSDAELAPERFRLARVSTGLFAMIDVAPILGRSFIPDDERPGAPPVVLLSDAVWRDRYQRSTAVVGRTVAVNGEGATIVGVMPEGFRFPVREDLWMALVPTETERTTRTRFVMPIGVLKPGVSASVASSDLAAIAARVADTHPETSGTLTAGVLTFQKRFNGDAIETVFALMLGAAAFVLLVACANVANLMLGRALARSREVSIRAALGASRWRLVRQFLVESVVLSVFGGMCGLAIAFAGVRAFAAAAANIAEKPYWIDFSLDGVVIAYFAAISILTGMLFGLAPALRSTRGDLNSAMKDNARAAGTQVAARLSGVLVVAQFTIAVVLLAGAGLFVRSAMLSMRVNGFMPVDHILTATVELPASRYPDTEARRRFWSALDERLAGMPGVEGAALTGNLPGMGTGARRLEVDGAADTAFDQLPRAWFLPVSPGYFSVINLPIREGRAFDERDGLPGAASAVVAPDFAARFWPGGHALGRRFRFRYDSGPGTWLTVVGIAGSIQQDPMSRAPLPLVYIPTRADNSSAMRVMIRTAGDPTRLAHALRANVRALDDTLALSSINTVRAILQDHYWFLPLFGTVFSVFAGFGLLMAAAGIYAVLAQHTARRTREIGIRMALGATSRQILRMILSLGAKQLALGLVLGLAGAFAVTRLMADMLLGISPTDPLVFGLVSVVLVGVGLFACWLPARRAAALPPTEALRQE